VKKKPLTDCKKIDCPDHVAHLCFNEVKLSCTRVHHRVKVFVACELGFDETADVGLKNKSIKSNQKP